MPVEDKAAHPGRAPRSSFGTLSRLIVGDLAPRHRSRPASRVQSYGTKLWNQAMEPSYGTKLWNQAMEPMTPVGRTGVIATARTQ
jgi:hypothetical protein